MQYHLPHFILLVVSSGFATTAVVLRFWARKIKNQPLALHDYLTVLGLVSILDSSEPNLIYSPCQIFALAETGVSIYSNSS